mmetsp:Transcript_69049/g.202664  ORF Transcript_69049/g.202664 Transcript_69049/m.202664 type:complete len:183 (+) Transcript_69049:1605-2153(+)
MAFSLKRSNIIFMDEAPQPSGAEEAAGVTEPAMEEPMKELLDEEVPPPMKEPPAPQETFAARLTAFFGTAAEKAAAKGSTAAAAMAEAAAEGPSEVPAVALAAAGAATADAICLTGRAAVPEGAAVKSVCGWRLPKAPTAAHANAMRARCRMRRARCVSRAEAVAEAGMVQNLAALYCVGSG